jgi:predicted RNA-binding protein with PUA-like domain
MKKGDLAFFYHSNCKEPAIVGTMEIVQEHSPDCEIRSSQSLCVVVLIQ